MSTNNPTIPLWLDPFSSTINPPDPPSVNINHIDIARERIFSEPLIAQRIITGSNKGLALSEDEEGKLFTPSKWGHNLASAVAVLIPPLTDSQNPNEKRIRRKYQERLLLSQEDWPNLASAHGSAFLLCADHKPPEYGLPSQLYHQHNPDYILPWDDVHQLLEKITQAVSSEVTPTWIDSKTALHEALASIFSETFKNTHDHARSENDGSIIQTSIRAVYSRYYQIEDAIEIISKTDVLTPAERYIRGFEKKSLKPGVKPKNTIYPQTRGFLELSILDSGPGMAAKWLGIPVENIDPKEQLEAVLQCFGKGGTTTGTAARGFGLWKVLFNLRALKGFMSIRTNNIHAYRDFGHFSAAGLEESSDGQMTPKEQLYDWKRALVTTPSSYPHVKGTAISFLLPMGQV